MSHRITAVIGQREAIERLRDASAMDVPIVDLVGTLVIAPLDEAAIDAQTGLRPGARIDGFTYLSDVVEAALAAAAGPHAVAYIETSYFGGRGSQAAAVLGNGGMLLRSARPVVAHVPTPEGPINAALRAIGVQATGGRDEFDTVGLGRFRSMASLGIAED